MKLTFMDMIEVMPKKLIFVVIPLILICIVFMCCAQPLYNIPMVETTKPTIVDKVEEDKNILMFIMMSGGGTRAAKMSWEVMKFLESIPYTYNDSIKSTVARQADYISGISGGSFAAAAWCLYKDSMNAFDDRFLNQNVQLKLALLLLTSPSAWFSPYYNRINIASEYYDEKVFNGARFKDVPPHPVLWINSTHLALGSRFTYTDKFFTYLKSDLDAYWVGYATAASSAFPILLDPITLKNYGKTLPDSMLLKINEYKYAKMNSGNNIEKWLLCKRIEFFNDKSNKWNHMADGGLVDNQGIQAILDEFETNGILNKIFNDRENIPEHIVFININAGTLKDDKSCEKQVPPHVPAVINYTMTTSMDRLSGIRWEILKSKCKESWEFLTMNGVNIQPMYCIEVNFRNIKNDSLRQACMDLPTSFYLNKKQRETIEVAVPILLKENKEFNRFINNIKIK